MFAIHPTAISTGPPFLNAIDATLAASESEPRRIDSIASGFSYMLVANVLQRGIGFLRNIALCYYLSDQQLGRWGLTTSFLLIAAPMAVLGLPGTFGRFVESYRTRGQLKAFVGSLMTVAMIGYGLLALWLFAFPASSGSLIFGAPQSSWTMLNIAIALGCIILFNSATELISGLRLSKTASAMHAVNSLSLTILSCIALAWVRDWQVLVVAFSASALLGLLPGCRVLLQESTWGRPAAERFSPRELLQRVAPFAASVWAINLIMNTFDIVDRYMLLHFASAEDSSQMGQALVGQLHSGKLIPTLLANLAAMLGVILLPYMVVEWESGRKERVAASLRTSLKFGTMLLFGLSIGAMLVSPLMFRVVLAGRYADGLAILPAALLVCCWMAVATFLHNYFWCAEKGRVLGGLTMLALVILIALSSFLIPLMGIHGAMLANVLACGVLLLLSIGALRWLGVTLGWETLIVVALPISLALGTIPATMVFGTCIVVASRTCWILTVEEKQAIDAATVPLLNRAGIGVISIWKRT